MKIMNFRVLVMAFVAVVLMNSCSKDTEDASLVNRWKIAYIDLHTVQDGTVDTLVLTEGGSNDYFDIRTDGWVYSNADVFGGADTTAYVIKDSKFLSFERANAIPDTFNIEELTNSSVTLHAKRAAGNGYFEQIMKLKR